MNDMKSELQSVRALQMISLYFNGRYDLGILYASCLGTVHTISECIKRKSSEYLEIDIPAQNFSVLIRYDPIQHLLIAHRKETEEQISFRLN